MAGCTAKVNQMVEATEIESANDEPRSDFPEAVHTCEKASGGRIIAEEVRKERVPATESLGPPVRPFPDRIIEMGPELVQRFIGISDIPSERLFAGTYEISRSRGSVAVDPAFASQQPQRNA